jgi:hypothetical protein
MEDAMKEITLSETSKRHLEKLRELNAAGRIFEANSAKLKSDVELHELLPNLYRSIAIDGHNAAGISDKDYTINGRIVVQSNGQINTANPIVSTMVGCYVAVFYYDEATNTCRFLGIYHTIGCLEVWQGLSPFKQRVNRGKRNFLWVTTTLRGLRRYSDFRASGSSDCQGSGITGVWIARGVDVKLDVTRRNVHRMPYDVFLCCSANVIATYAYPAGGKARTKVAPERRDAVNNAANLDWILHVTLDIALSNSKQETAFSANPNIFCWVHVLSILSLGEGQHGITEPGRSTDEVKRSNGPAAKIGILRSPTREPLCIASRGRWLPPLVVYQPTAGPLLLGGCGWHAAFEVELPSKW